jgi:hypothetical protein
MPSIAFFHFLFAATASRRSQAPRAVGLACAPAAAAAVGSSAGARAVLVFPMF